MGCFVAIRIDHGTEKTEKLYCFPTIALIYGVTRLLFRRILLYKYSNFISCSAQQRHECSHASHIIQWCNSATILIIQPSSSPPTSGPLANFPSFEPSYAVLPSSPSHSKCTSSTSHVSPRGREPSCGLLFFHQLRCSFHCPLLFSPSSPVPLLGFFIVSAGRYLPNWMTCRRD